MKTTQHTPASQHLTPWRVVNAMPDAFQVWTREDATPGSRNNFVVADGIQDRAEAELIAAAPELLEALIIALPFVEDTDSQAFKDGYVARRIREIRSAIAKATGEAK